MTQISWRRGGVVALGVAAAVALGIAIGSGRFGPERHLETAAVPPAATVSPVPAAPAAAPEAAAEKTLPSFDAVTVSPDGHAVIAGRAAPGAQVTVMDHGQPIGKATADQHGEWVLIPDRPLPPGARQLSLAARQPGGDTAQSSGSVAVIVPEPAQPAGPSVAVLLPQNGEGAPRAMQLPARAGRHVTLDIVEYKAGGDIELSGRSDPAARIAILVNGRQLATTAADEAGQWSAALVGGVPVGRYRLQLEARGADGRSLGQLVVALRRAAPGELAPGDYLAVVPGNNLWHVAERSYGDGVHYLEIYRANPQRIADPNLIYPGQLLALPAKSPGR